MKCRIRRCWAFTLIELLVVIGILAIFIAILIPSLSRARASARTSGCLANQRALGQAMNVYYVDWGNPHTLPGDGYLTWPLMLFGQGKTLQSALVPGISFVGQLGSIPDGSPYRKILICPETTPPALNVGGAHRQVIWSWLSSRPEADSYAINDYLFGQLNGPLQTYRGMHLLNGSTIPVFMDGSFPDIWARPEDPAPRDLENPAPHGQGTNLTYNCINRHNMAVNVVFFDAHAEAVKLPNLWTLKWSSNWDRTTPQVVPGK